MRMQRRSLKLTRHCSRHLLTRTRATLNIVSSTFLKIGETQLLSNSAWGIFYIRVIKMAANNKVDNSYRLTAITIIPQISTYAERLVGTSYCQQSRREPLRWSVDVGCLDVVHPYFGLHVCDGADRRRGCRVFEFVCVYAGFLRFHADLLSRES